MRLKNKKYEKKGISVIAFIIIIGVMLILISTVTVSLDSVVTNSRKRQFAKEIFEIQTMVDSYKKHNNDYPYIKTAEGNKIIELEKNNKNEDQLASEDIIDNKVELYVINLQKIGVNELSRGYNKDNDVTDVYAFSNKTGKVYYVKGYKVRKNKYYSLTDELKKLIGINTSGNSSSIILREENYIYSEANNYIKNGLVLHVDGMQNTKKGHSINTAVWEDLSGNGNDLTLENISWTGDSVVFNESLAYTDNTVENITVEIVVKEDTSKNGPIYIGWFGNNRHMMAYYDNNCIQLSNNVKFYQLTNNYTRNSISAIYKSTTDVIDKCYINSKQGVITSSNDSWAQTAPHYIQIGKYGNTNNWRFAGEICAIRIYNRALTEEEIKHNYEIDKERFNLE